MRKNWLKHRLSIYVLVCNFILLAVLTIPNSFTVTAMPQLPIPPGIPRGDVLVIENGVVCPGGWGPDPYQFNYYQVGWATACTGFLQTGCGSPLWYMNLTSGELILWLTEKPPIYSTDYKTLWIMLRKGISWSDGHPFTADDLIFTIEYCRKYPELGLCNVRITTNVESVRKLDDYTVEIKLKEPNPYYHYEWTMRHYGWPVNFYVIPKHVFEKIEDPVKYKFYPPVCLGPYKIVDADPTGKWYLWERLENWWGTKLLGIKPSPKYILFVALGSQERSVIAMANNELDFTEFTSEYVRIIMDRNPYAWAWNKRDFPWAWTRDEGTRELVFNILKYPFNLTEVRWALTYAIDYKVIFDAYKTPDGSSIVPNPLPVSRFYPLEQLYVSGLKTELMKYNLDTTPPSYIQDYLRVLGLDDAITWYKHDLEKAEELLKSVGFYRGSDGKWRLPDGKIFEVNLISLPGAEFSFPLVHIVADQWRRFGVDVKLEVIEAYWDRVYSHTWDVAFEWPGGGFPTLDWWETPREWHSKNCVPGARLPWVGYIMCYGLPPEKIPEGVRKNIEVAKTVFPDREKLDNLVEKYIDTPPWDPRIVDIVKDLLSIHLKYKFWITVFSPARYMVGNSYCWEGWPTLKERYAEPKPYCSSFLFTILGLKPSERCPIKESTTEPAKVPKGLTVELKPLVSEYPPTVTPTVITTPTMITITVVEERTRTIISTITTKVVEEVPTIDWTLLITMALVTLVIGAAGGYLIRARKK
ncbi:MAG: ABC transporter substrate-binding protein [Aigarchaeota archaeon]|nr:ABC transporter substrate-binding protein [Aigarchaeota archaeon]MCX8193407.1 ABC transporter substrate-binding protein [Nitrososphaeria archaeon]MDW7985937.1 ABC transporter substrate-binding protein [Nitrososphaerota archaeon]